MQRLFNAFLFKIRKDITFRITIIIGAALAIFMTVLYGLLEHFTPSAGIKYLDGQSMLLNSMSPIQNYGIAIPVNLISFTCLEFTQGTIRNKIIAGNSKFKIYASLCLSGLVFAFSMLIVYIGLCTALGSIFGGFDLDDVILVAGISAGKVDAKFILLSLLMCALVYISLTMFAIFIATTFRTMGPAIPIVMVSLMFCYIGAIIVASSSYFIDNKGLLTAVKIIDPLFSISGGATISEGEKTAFFETDTVVLGAISNVFYAGAFFTVGSILFKKRDVK